MKTSPATDLIDAALSKAQAEMTHAVFDKVNPHFKSSYASLNAILDAVRAHLAKHGISVSTGCSFTDDGAFYAATRLLHKGQWIESQWPISVGAPQSMGSQMTYAERYNLSALCAIAADEDDDGEAAQANHIKSSHALRKAKVYPPAEKALRNVGSLEDLQAIWSKLQPELREWPATWRELIAGEKDRRKLELADELTDSDQDDLKSKLRRSIAEEIDDELPEEGGGDEAA